MSTPNLSIQYLVAGPCSGGKPAVLTEKTLELVSNQFFGVEVPGGKQTLVMTDGKGVLRSLNNDLSYKTQPKQHLTRVPMHLSIVPDGVTRMTYFAVEQKWQKRLIDQINAANHSFLETIPVTFSKKHLVAPGESASQEEKNAFAAIGDGELVGQLIRKFRGVFIIFSAGYFKDGAISAVLYNGKAEKVKTLKSDAALSFSYVSSFNNETKDSTCRVFWVDDIEYALPEGKYRIEISRNDVTGNLAKWCTHNGVRNLSFIIEVKYSVHTLTGDFDFHQLDPLSLEESLVLQFPHRFSHITGNIIKEPSKTPDSNYKDYKSCLKTWVERTEWMNAKRKMVTGFIKGENDARIKKIGSLLIDGLKSSAGENEELKKDAELLAKGWESVFSLHEAAKSWNDYLERLKVADSVKKIRQVVDKNWIAKAVRDTRWQKYLLAHAGDENKSQLVIDLLDKGLTKEKAAILIKDGIPKETLAFDATLRKAAGKALAVLDTAITLHQIANLFIERRDLEDKYDLNNNRFISGADKYLAKFGARANVQAITMLEALRRTADATRMKLDDNAKQLMLQSVDFMLGALMCVPAVGEVAALIAVTKATLEAVANYAATVGKLIDSKMLNDFFNDLKGYFDKLAELEKESSINMDGIAALLTANKKDGGPAVQFRLRAAILTGLLRLIDRCGTRINNDAEFVRKFKQYDIEGYIKAFITNANPKMSISIQSDIPLDEMWLFCNGNKEGMGLAAVHRGFRMLEKYVWAMPAVMTAGPVGAGAAMVGKAVALKMSARVPVAYQRMFPIHLISSDPLKVARLFSTNYSGVKKSNLIYSNVYVNVNDSWQEVSTYKGMITPLSPIRVIVILAADNRSDSLAGLPVSLQLVRTDTWPDTYGPVYKGIVQRLDKTENGGFDKGLLSAECVNYPPDKHYGFILHPFYFFEDALFKGIKPCGSVFTTTDDMETKFVLKIDDKDMEVKLGSNNQSEFRVGLPKISPILNMVLRPDFLGNKTNRPVLAPVFIKNLSHVKPLGYFIHHASGWVFKELSTKELFNFVDFDFAWDKKFEIIFVMKTAIFHQTALKNPVIKFPVQVTAFENVEWATDTAGPSYPAEGIGCKDAHFYRGRVSVREIEAALRSSGVFGSADKVANGSHQIEFRDAGYMVAVRTKFAYSVEATDGEMASFEAFKPFSEKLKNANDFYQYYFKIDAPAGIDLEGPIEFEAKFHLPALPSPAPKTMQFLSSAKFVTGKSNLTSLEVQECDYK